MRRLLALLVARDFLMDANRNGIWVHSKHIVKCVCNFSKEIYDTLWVMVGTGTTKGLHLKETSVVWW